MFLTIRPTRGLIEYVFFRIKVMIDVVNMICSFPASSPGYPDRDTDPGTPVLLRGV